MSDDELVAALTEWQRGYLVDKITPGLMGFSGRFDTAQWRQLFELGLVDTHAELTGRGRAIAKAVKECEAATCVLQRAERNALDKDHR